MTYDQAIAKIMPEVESGSEEPFIFYRGFKGDWYVDFVYEQLDDTQSLYQT